MCSRNINFSLQFSSTLHFNSIDIVHAFTDTHTDTDTHKYAAKYPSVRFSVEKWIVTLSNHSSRIVFNLFSYGWYLFWETIWTICWHVVRCTRWAMHHTPKIIFSRRWHVYILIQSSTLPQSQWHTAIIIFFACVLYSAFNQIMILFNICWCVQCRWHLVICAGAPFHTQTLKWNPFNKRIKPVTVFGPLNGENEMKHTGVAKWKEGVDEPGWSSEWKRESINEVHSLTSWNNV